LRYVVGIHFGQKAQAQAVEIGPMFRGGVAAIQLAPVPQILR